MQKCTKINFFWGSAPDSAEEGPTSKGGRDREGTKWEWKEGETEGGLKPPEKILTPTLTIIDRNNQSEQNKEVLWGLDLLLIPLLYFDTPDPPPPHAHLSSVPSRGLTYTSLLLAVMPLIFKITTPNTAPDFPAGVEPLSVVRTVPYHTVPHSVLRRRRPVLLGFCPWHRKRRTIALLSHDVCSLLSSEQWYRLYYISVKTQPQLNIPHLSLSLSLPKKSTTVTVR